MSQGGAWPPAVLGPLEGASVWSITANGPGGPFGPFTFGLSRARGTPVPVVLTAAPRPTPESKTVSRVWGQELLPAPRARATRWVQPFFPLWGSCRPFREGRRLGSMGFSWSWSARPLPFH
jgi:hypothetical protein